MSQRPTAHGADAVPTGSAGHPQRSGIVLTVILACQLIVLMDATVVTVALPAIGRDLHFTAAGLSWVQNAYMLAFGGLLLVGGRAGDVFGRRKMLLIGVTTFTIASLLGGLATNTGWLLATRAVQGASAALTAPSTLALLTATFAEGPRRNRVLGIYSAISGAGLAIGLILGGLLTEASWRWVMFINVPIGAAVLLLGSRVLPEPERHHARLDLPGGLTATIAMAALVYGLIRGAAGHWGDAPTVVALVIAAASVATFLALESRSRQPLVPLALFAQRNRSVAYFNMLLIPAAMFAMFFFLTQYLQDNLGFSPLQAGLAFLPLAVTQLAAARTAPLLIPRIGAKPITVAGTTLITAGIAWLTRLSTDTGYLTGLLGPMLLFGVGVGLCFMPLNMIIMSGLPPQSTGAASGVLQAMQQLGGSLGLAILVTVFDTARRHHPSPAPGTSPLAYAHNLLADGIATAFIAATIFTATALTIAILAIRHDKPTPQ